MNRLFTSLRKLPRGQQAFLVGLATLIVIPFIVLLFLQVYNAYTLTVLGNDIAFRENVWKADAKMLNAKVDPESLKTAASQHAYRLLAAHDILVPERRLVATIQVPLGDMKIRNRKAPAVDALVNAAAADIQKRGEEECRLLIASLAAHCTVMAATGRVLGDTAYEYQIQLAFAERRPLGKVDAATSYEFIVSRSSPGRIALGQRVYFEKSASQRQKIYKDVAETCAAIRKSSGNCSITAFSIAARLDRGTPMVRFAASAAYASLVKGGELAATAH